MNLADSTRGRTLAIKSWQPCMLTKVESAFPLGLPDPGWGDLKGELGEDRDHCGVIPRSHLEVGIPTLYKAAPCILVFLSGLL